LDIEPPINLDEKLSTNGKIAMKFNMFRSCRILESDATEPDSLIGFSLERIQNDDNSMSTPRVSRGGNPTSQISRISQGGNSNIISQSENIQTHLPSILATAEPVWNLKT